MSPRDQNGVRTDASRRPMYVQRARVAEVVDFIQRNLDSKLSVERLGRFANLSKYHFHRQFSETIGLGPMRVVQLLRLKNASLGLVFEQSTSITDIALDAGFANSESFSRAFRAAFGQSPREFRRRPKWALWRNRYRFLARVEKTMNKVEIVDFPATKVAVLEHRGSPDEVYNTSRKFIEWRRANGVSPATSRTFGVHYDDHNAVRPEDYRLDLCATVDADVSPNPQGVITKIIPGARCARIRHVGSREHITSAEYLYNNWLPKSGERPSGAPAIFHYVNVGPNIADQDMITDVYLPLE